MSRSLPANPFKRNKAHLNIETLENRLVPSCSSISGFVYHDANANGHFDAGETPIANSPIELRDANNVLIGSTMTDANGHYEFDTDISKPATDETLTKTVDFPSTQTNFALDGMLDQFDPSLGTLVSVEIKHDASITSEIKAENVTTLSESDISGTISGSLTLTAPGVNNKVDISGYAGSAHLGKYDGTTDYSGASGTTFGQKTASGTNTTTVTGSAINAYIGTGQVKVTETSNATSHADGGGNLDAQIRSTATGKITVIYHYKATPCIAPGNYKIIQTTEPTGFTDGLEEKDGTVIPNTIGTDFINVTLNNNDLVNNNFGELQSARLSGHVYHDANNDGHFDASEDPIAGVLVTLTGPGGTKTATTNAAGFYEFTDLNAGTYQVNETQPTSFLDGKDTAGTTGGAVTNDQIASIALPANGNSQNNDFGELKPASIAGHVYVDANNNGIRDTGEAPIPGTKVTLTGFDDQGPVSQQATTDSTGSYQFTGLRPGAYALTETQPTGFDDGKDKVGSQGGTLGNDVFSDITLTAGVNGVNNDFGELRPDQPGTPLPKDIQPLGGVIPVVSKIQLTTSYDPSMLDPVLRGQMAFVVGATVSLTGQQPNAAQVMSAVQQLQSGMPQSALIAQLWASDTHRAIQAASVYQDVLNRAPTGAESAAAMQALAGGTTELALKEQLFTSQEYQQAHPTTDSLVQGLYADILNKVPGTQATQTLVQSMDNQPLQDVVHGLLVSDDSLANLIDDVFRETVRRPATAAEVATWSAPIKAGTMSLDDLSQRLLASQEFYQLASASVH